MAAEWALDPIEGLGELVREFTPEYKLGDEETKYVASHTYYKLVNLMQTCKLFAVKAKRDTITKDDFKNAVECKSKGDSGEWFLGNGNFGDERGEIDILELLARPLPTLPPEPDVYAHWLAIDGVIPATRDNVSDNKIGKTGRKARLGPGRFGQFMPTKSSNRALLKTQLIEHSVSMEHQLLFNTLTSAVIGFNETERKSAMQSLQEDASIGPMGPYLVHWIVEGVKTNIASKNFLQLMYLIGATQAVANNDQLNLSPYLHILLPALISCIVAKRCCEDKDIKNHWTLRDYASKILILLSLRYNSLTNNIIERVTKVFVDTINDETKSFASVYGALTALSDFGPTAFDTHVVRKGVVRMLSKRIHPILKGNNLPDRLENDAGKRLSLALVKHVSEYIVKKRSPPDEIDEFKKEFGFMGAHIHIGVLRLRKDPRDKVLLHCPKAGGPGNAAMASILLCAPITGSQARQQNFSSRLSYAGIHATASIANADALKVHEAVQTLKT